MTSRTLATNTAMPPRPAALIHHPSDESSNTCLKNIIMSCICSRVTRSVAGGSEGLTPPPSFLLADMLDYSHDYTAVACVFRVNIVPFRMPAHQVLDTMLQGVDIGLNFIREKLRCKVFVRIQRESLLGQPTTDVD